MSMTRLEVDVLLSGLLVKDGVVTARQDGRIAMKQSYKVLVLKVVQNTSARYSLKTQATGKEIYVQLKSGTITEQRVHAWLVQIDNNELPQNNLPEITLRNVNDVIHLEAGWLD